MTKRHETTMLQYLTYLTPRQQKMIRMRFGLDDGVAHTLEDVAKEFGVTPETLRRIESRLGLSSHPSKANLPSSGEDL